MCKDQIPGELLPASWQPRVRIDQPHLRLLRRMQTPLQHQTMEDIHGLLQLPAHSGHHRREDFLLPRRSLARPPVYGADQAHNATHRCARYRPLVRSTLVRSRQGRAGMGRKRSWCLVYFRRRCCCQVPQSTRYGSHMSCSSG